ncbi:hypothetical protein PQR63_16650 [Herbaspirillum rhizosphaerae]|uniref:Transmembrane protein n=1 Tax=Herbaspirillum rhizosphaerae TaxID=346179 RepID=A0ABW8ZA56_9BURK
MLYQILIHTPLWVWAMLGFLAYRGWSAGFDRETLIVKVALVPLLMLGLSGHGLYELAHADALVLGAALLAALASGIASWTAAGKAGTVAYPERGTVFLRGSWFPLMMMTGVFAVKYAMGVLTAMHSPWAQGGLVVIAVGVLYGLFIGVSAGRMLRILHLYRRAQLPAAELSV